MKAKVQAHLDECKRRLEQRLDPKKVWTPQPQRMFRDTNVHYDLPHPDRLQGFRCAGMGAVQLLVAKLGLADAIDERLHLLKRHLPYFESDHVLNLTYNLLAGGTTLGDLELLRNHPTYLDSLDAQRIPDPTTAGDFLRRFSEDALHTLMGVINEVRLRVWQQQPQEFFAHGIVDVDGSVLSTYGECKGGMDYSYQKVWGYHPLLVSLANTQEALFLCNRSGNRPSHEHAADYLNQALALLQRAGFAKISFRGDTDFSQTRHLDGWDAQGVRFVFGIDAQEGLKAQARALSPALWRRLTRRPAYEVQTQPRQRPVKVKQERVRERGYRVLHLLAEHVAEFPYQPEACTRSYRVVVLRKLIEVRRHGQVIGEEIRYLFWISNEQAWPAEEVVFFANGRCQQENLIEQLKNGVRGLHAPVNSLHANWAYMVIGGLAWSLKAWLGLIQTDPHRKATLLKIEFKKFSNEWMRIPCQVIRSGRRVVYRLLQWKPWAEWLFTSVDILRRLQWT